MYWIHFVSGIPEWNATPLNSQFSYLDPSSQAPEEAPQDDEDHIWLKYFPTPIREGYYFDGWYTGRMENGEIIYDKQVTDDLEDTAVPGSTSSVKFTEGASIVIDENGSYINGGGLSLKGELTLFAKWRPHSTADYKVIIWKQKVTDGKNTPEAERTYDYYSYTLMENQASDKVILDDPEYIEKGFELMTESSDPGIIQDFTCFHYSRTTVKTHGHTFDGRIPTDRVQGTVNPDGSTVVNVFYDRDLMAINFYYKKLGSGYSQTSTAPAGATTPYTYEENMSESDSQTRYGLTGDGYVELERAIVVEQDEFVYRYSYTEASKPNSGGYVSNVYIVDQEQQMYVKVNRLYWYRNTWYQNRSGGMFNYSYSDPYNGNVYVRAEYHGNEYEGKRYKRVNGVFEETEDETGDELYGWNEDEQIYRLITKISEPVYEWRIKSTHEPYSGKRYTRTALSGYEGMVTWTGLYGRTFEKVGYDWNVESIKNYVWKEDSGSGTTQTMLYGFIQTQNPYDLYLTGNNSDNQIRHYTETLTDGVYDENAAHIARTSQSAGISFTFSNKFNGFTVKYYAKSFGDTKQEISIGESMNSLSTPFCVFHERNAYTVTFADFYTPNNLPAERKDLPAEQRYVVTESVKYEASLAGFNSSSYTPPARRNYTFGGWYMDEGCTKPFDFEHETMPAANVVVYPKWEYKYYFVEIDPNGGVMENELEFQNYTGYEAPQGQSAYTWIQHGNPLLLDGYMSIRREYVPDDTHGSYRYVNVKFAESFESACTKDWSKCLPANYRSAFYCLDSELETVYNEHFKQFENTEVEMTWEFFRDYCVSPHKYRHIDDAAHHYELVGWYLVRENGEAVNDLYKSGDAVIEPIRVRAIWRAVGEFYLKYDPYDDLRGIGRDVNVFEQDGSYSTHTNPTIYDPNDPSAIGDGEKVEKFLDKGKAVVRPLPAYIPEGYVFRGWNVLDKQGHATELFYDPGDIYTIDADYADSNGMITLMARYEPELDTVRRPDVAELTLDANGGTVMKHELDENHLNHTYVNLQDGAQQIKFHKELNNFSVDLNHYYNYFVHPQGYLLIGWNETPDPEGYIPEYPADAIIGADKNNIPPQTNTLYAVWEPMYYLTLENHSPDYDITFHLKITNHEGEIYVVNTNTVTGHFDRKPLSEYDGSSESHITAIQRTDGNGRLIPGEFDVTIQRTTDTEHDPPYPSSVKLVIPQGAQGQYTVDGSIDDAVTPEGTKLSANTSNKLTVYNTGGADDSVSYSNNRWHNFLNTNVSSRSYSVSGDLIHGSLGQTVAFYTGNIPKTQIKLAVSYYDPAADEEAGAWVQGTTTTGPRASLSFENYSNTGAQVRYDANDGYPYLDNVTVFSGTQANTISIAESFDEQNSNYKFIGWYLKNEAEPGDVELQTRENPDDDDIPDARIDKLPVPNQHMTYYALYVPYVSGELEITHQRKSTSLGYAKKLSVAAVYTQSYDPDAAIESYPYYHEDVNNQSLDKYACAQIEVPVNERNASTQSLTLKVRAMSGFGCVYHMTYLGERPLNKGDLGTYTEEVEDPTGSGDTETKHYYTLTYPLSECLRDSDTVKGLKVIEPIRFYSDFTRKYEFTYEYMFRDGETPRKYVVAGQIEDIDSEEDFKRFIAECAPTVSNFGERLSWDLGTITINNLFSVGKITATIKSNQPKLDYVIVDELGYYDAIPISWKVAIGRCFPDGEGNRPIAKTKFYDENTGKWMKFVCWQVYDKDEDGRLIETDRCYYHEFTFAVWGDITIKPIYTETTEEQEYERVMPSTDSTYVRMRALDNTRNQWVDLNEDNTIYLDSDGKMVYNDNLISDFDLAFIDKGIRLDSDPDKYKLGLIYEVVGSCTINDDGMPVQGDISDGLTDDKRRTLVSRIDTMVTDDIGAITSKGEVKCYYSKIDPRSLTFDNHLEYYRGIDNLRGAEGSLNPNALRVFKVYAYMIKTNENNEKEYYFSNSVNLQMYDLAVS